MICCMRGRISSMARGVNAFVTMLRRRVCSGGSRRRMLGS